MRSLRVAVLTLVAAMALASFCLAAWEHEDSQYRNGEALEPAKTGSVSLIRFDANVLPAARSRGARACEQAARAVRSRVVRSTAGNPKGLKGFDSEDRKETIVPAALSRRDQRANPNCERQRRGFASGCGLSDVDVQGARVARRRNHTSWLTEGRRAVSEILTVVEAPTPWCQEQPIASKSDTHVSEVLSDAFEDRGSIPRGSTKEETSHVAPWGKPRTSKYEGSQLTNPSVENGAHGGLLECAVSVPRAGVETSTLMADGRNDHRASEGVQGTLPDGCLDADGYDARKDGRERPADEIAQPGSAPSSLQTSSEVAGSNPALVATPRDVFPTVRSGAPAAAPSIRSSRTSATEVRADHSAVKENARERATNFARAA